MYRCLFSLFLTFVVLSGVNGQSYKVTESSTPSRPAWFDGKVDDSVVASGEGADLKSAMAACEIDIKRKVTNAVGLAIGQVLDTLSTHNINQQGVQSDGKSYGEIFADNFESFIANRADKVKYFTEISVEGASDLYWEKRAGVEQDKRTLYMVKYPLPSSEVRKLVANYKRFSDANYKELMELKQLAEKGDKIASVEDIDSAMMRAGILLSSFVDVQRHKEAVAVQKSIYDLYSKIKVETLYSKIGCEEVALILDGHSITYGKKPTIQSMSVSDVSYHLNTTPFAMAVEDSRLSAKMEGRMKEGAGPNGGEGKAAKAKIVRAQVDTTKVDELRKLVKDSYLLRYGYEKCHSGETTVIQLDYKFGTVKYKYLISFDIDRYKPTLQVLGDGHVKAGIRESGHASGLNVTLPLRLYNCQKVFVSTITLQLPGVEYPIVINNVGQTFVGSGSHTLKVYYPNMIRYNRRAGGNINNQISGTISGQINEDQEFHEPFFLNVQSNWL